MKLGKLLFSFEGRITRGQWWAYALPYAIIGWCLHAVDSARGTNFELIYGLVTLYPTLAVGAKRLHDAGISAWFLLSWLVPVVGWIWYFIQVGFMEGTMGRNKYGADAFGEVPGAGALFGQTFAEGRGDNKTSWTVSLAFTGLTVILAAAILIPMIYFDALPKSQLTSFLVAPPPPPPPPPPPAAAPKVIKVIPRQFDAGRLMAPKVVPKEIAMIKEEELPPPSAGGVVGGVPGGVPGGTAGGVIGGIIGSVPTAAPPPPPPAVKVEKPVTPQRIRVGGNVQAAKLIRQPRPIYPPLAKQARISGHVILNAIIGKDGTIQNLSVASGHPLLVPAAMEAVKQWVYQPTLLNGEPVEVVTQIDVNFTLSQ